MKHCFKCQRLLPYTEFYRHPAMGDGHLGKCKECTRRDVKKNYQDNFEHYREYERQRFNDPERKQQILTYQRKRRLVSPEKARAYYLVYQAVKRGTLIRKPCEVCGDTNTQAHHEDYSKPLDVRWFCFLHHRREGHDQLKHLEP